MLIAKVRDVKTPTRGTQESAGIDFYVPNDYPESLCTVDPGQRLFIPSGIRANVPAGHALIAFNKSGISVNKGFLVGASVVDSDYQGEIHVHLINASSMKQTIEPGQKIVQFLLVPVDHCTIEETTNEELFDEVTERGTGGFGSTGLL